MNLASLASSLSAATQTNIGSTAGPSSLSKPSLSTTGPSTAPAKKTTESAPSSRPAAVSDPGYITVEPDGRDDVTFRDRLLQAIKGFFETFQKNADEQAERAFAAIESSIAAAEESGTPFFAQLRVTSIETTLANPGQEDAGFASIRQLGLEIAIARDGKVEAADTRVLDLEGRSAGLSEQQIRAGLGKPNFERIDTGSDRDRARLEAARESLERVTQVQDALKAYRGGDIEPLRRFFEDNGDTGVSRALGGSFGGGFGSGFGAAFPTRGAINIEA